MAVTFDSGGSIKAETVSSLTVTNLVVGNNPNRCLLAFVGTGTGGTTPTVSSVVFNGSENFTSTGVVLSAGTRACRIEVFRLLNPTATTANVVATFSGSAAGAGLGVCSYYNVDQTTPIGETTTQQQGGVDAEAVIALDPGNGNLAPSGSLAVAGCFSVDIVGSTDYTLAADTSAFALFESAGTANSATGQTSRTPALPAVLRMGELIFASCASENNATHSCSTTGWNKLVQTNSGAGWTHSIWYARYDGTTAAPVITWTGSADASSRCWQYRRADPDNTPVALLGTVGTGTGSTHSSTGGNTTQNNVVAQYIDHANANTALGAPGGSWTERFDAGSATGPYRLVAGDQDIATSGTGSGNLSMSGANAAWVQQQMEIYQVGVQQVERTTTGGSGAVLHMAVSDMVAKRYNQFIWNATGVANIDNNVMAAVTLLEATGTSLTAPKLGSESELFAHSVTPVLSITAPKLSSSGVLRAHTVTPVISTTAPLLTSGSLLRAHSLQLGLVSGKMASAGSLKAHTLNISIGTVAPKLDSTSVLKAHTVQLQITSPKLASTSVLRNHTVTPELLLTSAKLASTSVLRAHAVHLQIVSPKIASGSVLRAHSIIVGGEDVSLIAPKLGSASVLRAHTVQLSVTAPKLASSSDLKSHAVQLTISPAKLLSSSVLREPSVTLELTLQAPKLGSVSVLYPPVIFEGDDTAPPRGSVRKPKYDSDDEEVIQLMAPFLGPELTLLLTIALEDENG